MTIFVVTNDATKSELIFTDINKAYEGAKLMSRATNLHWFVTFKII